jgi:hypothetical protein
MRISPTLIADWRSSRGVCHNRMVYRGVSAPQCLAGAGGRLLTDYVCDDRGNYRDHDEEDNAAGPGEIISVERPSRGCTNGKTTRQPVARTLPTSDDSTLAAESRAVDDPLSVRDADSLNF